MKRLLFLLAFLAVSCQSLQVVVDNFEVESTSIIEGGLVKYNWKVQNTSSIIIQYKLDDEILYETEVKNGVGNGEFVPSKIGKGNLLLITLEDKEEIVHKAIPIDVKSKPILAEKPSQVVNEQESKEKSNYLKGLLPYDKMGKRNINYEIFAYDRSGYPNEVKLYVSVKDEFGNFVSNLALPYGVKTTSDEYFKSLFETIKGEKSQIESFNVKEYHDEYSDPYTFELVLDHSGSMSGNDGSPIKLLQESAIEFINNKNSDDKVGVFKFDNRGEQEVEITSSLDKLNSEYKKDLLTRYGQGTAMITAADFGVKYLADYKNKVLILFTDGQDNSSLWLSLINNSQYAYNTKDLIYNARANDIKIYTVGFAGAEKEKLSKIAALTDGQYFFANSASDIKNIFSSLPRLFHNYYIITYKPVNKNGWHNLDLVCKQLDGTEVAVKGKTFIGDDLSGEIEEENTSLSIAHFSYNESLLYPNEIANIGYIVTFLKKYPNKVIEIHGHTDSKGTPNYNVKLSKKRANNVKNKLIESGIERDRIKVFGHGFENPINPVEYADWQAIENRRVDIILLDKEK